MRREASEAPDPGVLDFYSRHPINVEQILGALRERGTALDGLRPEDLFDLDQDHYGGLAAVDSLAERARIGPESRVLDLCAGLGGPARYLAHRLGCRVTALDLNPSRCVGAHRLNGLVGLSQVVQVARGNATTLPFQSESFNACISQEAFLHIPRKAALLRECRRVLKP